VAKVIRSALFAEHVQVVHASFITRLDALSLRAAYSAPVLLERDRFFPAPLDCLPGGEDAQNAALSRLIARCERVRPHLSTVLDLEHLIAGVPDPARVRRRIALALSLENPDRERPAGPLLAEELERFRRLARCKLPAYVWVFS
jgi:hypothetical protein